MSWIFDRLTPFHAVLLAVVASALAICLLALDARAQVDLGDTAEERVASALERIARAQERQAMAIERLARCPRK